MKRKLRRRKRTVRWGSLGWNSYQCLCIPALSLTVALQTVVFDNQRLCNSLLLFVSFVRLRESRHLIPFRSIPSRSFLLKPFLSFPLRYVSPRSVPLCSVLLRSTLLHSTPHRSSACRSTPSNSCNQCDYGLRRPVAHPFTRPCLTR